MFFDVGVEFDDIDIYRVVMCGNIVLVECFFFRVGMKWLESIL